jgi:ferritin heavy chain
MAMGWYYDRDDVALPGLHSFFRKLSDEKREWAEKMMKYQNMRGGRILLIQIQGPERDTWGSALDAMQTSLEIEKNLNKSLLDLHSAAERSNDAQMGDWIEDEFLHESVDCIKKISDQLTALGRVGAGLGEYVFDEKLKS